MQTLCKPEYDEVLTKIKWK